MSELIDRQAAIDAFEDTTFTKNEIRRRLSDLPPAQPEPTDIDAREAVYNLAEKIGIHQLFALTVELRGEPIQPEPTDEQAIVHLQSSGWMQRHDKAMYESGLKDQLADDSDSYDSLLPSAQPERQRGEWIEISSINHTYKCSECGRLLVNVADGRNNVSKHYPYCHCGADMRGEKDERTD